MNNLPVPTRGNPLGNVQAQVTGEQGGGFAPNGNMPSMGHSAEDSQAMGDILSRLRDLEDEGLQSHTVTESYGDYDSVDPSVKQSLQTPSGDSNIDAMKGILLKLQNVGNDTTKELIQESAKDVEIKEALSTRRTKTGVSIGQYEIRVRVDESKKRSMNYFDVVKSGTNTAVAKDLILYEAALILTKKLNRGETIESSGVKRLLHLEETYYKHRVDAARYRVKSKQCFKAGDHNRSEMFEHRYEDTKSKALRAKQDIVTMGSKL